MPRYARNASDLFCFVDSEFVDEAFRQRLTLLKFSERYTPDDVPLGHELSCLVTGPSRDLAHRIQAVAIQVRHMVVVVQGVEVALVEQVQRVAAVLVHAHGFIQSLVATRPCLSTVVHAAILSRALWQVTRVTSTEYLALLIAVISG